MAKTTHTPLLEKPSRKIDRKTAIFLYTRAGGRCEFPGCPTYLLAHHVTQGAELFGEAAHIWAFKEHGPRGKDSGRPGASKINAVDNLMLLCPSCHSEIDQKHPDLYSVDKLRGFKKSHEDRILMLTGLDPNRPTCMVFLKARVRGQVVDIPPHEAVDAIAPRCPKDPHGYLIDISALEDDGSESYFTEAMKTIDRDMDRIYAKGWIADQAQHVSFFGLAPIPVLAYVGHKASTKITLDAYQRQRLPEGWAWKAHGPLPEYRYDLLKKGDKAAAQIVLMLSLSQKIHADQVPSTLTGLPLHELTLNGTPSVTFLNTRNDLEAFRKAYIGTLGEIRARYSKLKTIHLLAAVPAPVAVFCGRERLPSAHPEMAVYHYTAEDGYIPTPVRLK